MARLWLEPGQAAAWPPGLDVRAGTTVPDVAILALFAPSYCAHKILLETSIAVSGAAAALRSTFMNELISKLPMSQAPQLSQ